jgi:PAS domain S-box-containing protein
MKKTLVILVIILLSLKGYTQVNYDMLKANWIFIISDNVTFPNENLIDTIRVAIYGKNSPVYPYAKAIEKDKTIKGKPVVVKEISRLQELKNFNVIYLDESKNDFIEAIYNKIHKTGTLLITYKNDDKNHIMINLLLKDRTHQFEIQSSNLFDEHIQVTEKLLSLGGNRIELQGLIDKKIRELNQKQKELNAKEQELVDKEKQLNKLSTELDKQKKENEKNSELIKKQQNQLKIEKQNAQKLLEQVAQQEQVLRRNQYILGDLNKQIKQKQEYIKQQNEELEKKKAEVQKKQEELAIQQKKIDSQKKVLKHQNVKIQTQQGIITITVIFVIVFLILLVIIWRSLAQNKRINRQLELKNAEIEQQKDELAKQALQLEEFNKELSKLSLVASKTDNSVIIMDKQGNFEWVNPGFTRLYGYTLQLLLQEKGSNIVDASEENQEERRVFIEKCVKDKKTVIYQAKNTTRKGDVIWVQTALTPVLDENDEVTKLIAIESNITKIKEQEQQIKQTNEELQMQKAELQAQKDLLEEVNKQIKDSINYALTIQSAILPLEKDITNNFAHFLIYLPRDIVSGDFYWFANPKPNMYFMAVVDCTGHGVPGAFMSLIASRMLDELVSIRGIMEPNKILEALNRMIISALSQKSTNNRDGMDLALVKMIRKEDQRQISFAGAKRPLIYYEKGTEIKTLKGNRRSIGGIMAKTDFEYSQEEIILHQGDLIYLTSDGFIDQNNPQRKRYGTPRFLRLLDEIKHLPLTEQKIKILAEFNKFKGDEEQRDDITVWAIKL